MLARGRAITGNIRGAPPVSTLRADGRAERLNPAFAKSHPVVQTIAARTGYGITQWKLRRSRMATDYDAPRKTEDDSESIEALKERVPDKLSGSVDVEDADNPSGFELPGADLSDLDLDVVVLPPQEDEFTCVSCFLVKHRSQLDHEDKVGPICTECAA